MRTDRETDARTVRIAAVKITEVLAARHYDSEIELLLAVGEACPFATWHDKEIWLGVFYRAAEDAGYMGKDR